MICFDLESTGLHQYKDRIIQIAAVLHIDGNNRSSFMSMVKADIPIQAAASKVTGITDSDLIHQPSCKQVLRAFFDWVHEQNLDQYTLSAYNGMKFDFPLLVSECKRNGLVLKKELYNLVSFIDPLHWARQNWIYRHNIRSLSLTNVYKLLFRQVFNNAHDAMADTIALVKVCTHESFADMTVAIGVKEGLRQWFVAYRNSNNLYSSLV